MTRDRTTPKGTKVKSHTAAYDVKYAASVGQGYLLSMECGCRITLSLTIGHWTYNFIERDTCGMSKSEESLKPDSSDHKIGLKKILDYVGVDADRMEEFLPNGKPSFDLLELIAQRQEKKAKSTKEGGVLV